METLLPKANIITLISKLYQIYIFFQIKIKTKTNNKDKTKIDDAIASIDEALKLDPNFNLASLSKQALEARKEKPEGEN